MSDRKERYIVDEKGKRTAVVLPLKEYEELLEDLHDLAIVAERRDEPTVSFGELKEKLKAGATSPPGGSSPAGSKRDTPRPTSVLVVHPRPLWERHGPA